MSDEPLVSITIPTMNSEDVIGGCLASVKRQSYSNIEILVVDSLSTDRTREIAASYGAKVINYEGRLLGARREGLFHSKGEYILLLDSDQILEETAIQRAIPMMDKYDMLVLEEFAYEPSSWLQKLLAADRELIHKTIDSRSLDPLQGTLLPRLFKRDILLKAFDAVAQELIPRVVHHDHAIIYYEARKISSKVGILEKGVYHRDPARFITIWKRNYRYGRSLREFPPSGRYKELVKKRDRGFRRGSLRPKNLGLGLRSFIILALLKAAQKAGYWLGGRLA